MSTPTLTAPERDDLWQRLFRFNADQLSDRELMWESGRWHHLGCPWAAALCEQVAAERREDGIELLGPPIAHGLDALFYVVPLDDVLARCATEAIPLVVSLRISFWVARDTGHDR